VPYALLVPVVLLPLAAAALALAWWLVQRWADRRDAVWKIERKDVIFDVPVKVLGPAATPYTRTKGAGNGGDFGRIKCHAPNLRDRVYVCVRTCATARHYSRPLPADFHGISPLPSTLQVPLLQANTGYSVSL
jgi:hypothetical protein